jgi:hypothetical protein
VRWVAPDTPQGVALWLTHLGGSAEQTAPMLARLSERELLAASFDPPGHAFLCGAADLHVPAEAAARFRTALCDAISARPIGCGSSCTRVSTTSTRRGTSGCTPPRSNGWRRAGRRADRTAAENQWDRINYLTSTARMRLPTTAT